MKCASCGGDAALDARYCQYCGGVLPAPPKSASRDEIFAAIKRSPQFEQAHTPERLARVPQPSGAHKAIFTIFSALLAGKVAMAVGGFIGVPILFLGFFFFVASRAAGPVGPSNLITLAILAIVGMLGLILVVSIVLGLLARKYGRQVLSSVFRKQEELEKAPLDVLPAIAVSKRTEVWGGSGDMAAKTNYYVTFELEDGSRREYALWYGTMYGRIVEDDAVVLFARGDYAADLDLVTV